MKFTRFVLALLLVSTPAAAQSKRPLKADDIYNLREVRDPQRSPDGKWVAYTVATAIKDTDKNNNDVWMVSWDGSQQIQITSTTEGESSAKWSPDGKYLSFVSSRMGAKGGQIWLLNRAGGEATKLTDIKGGVSDYAWSPDSKRLVLVVQDPDPSEKDADETKDKDKTPKPIVIDRYHFKADVEGFLRGERSHLQLFDITAKKAELLTSGPFNEEAPAWSPDGSHIAFVRRHGEGDVDKMPNNDIFVVEAKAGAQPKQLTTATADESGRPTWSPDSKSIAYLVGDEVKYSAYDQSKIAVIPAAGGMVRILAETLDRPVNAVAWSADGRTLSFIVTDDRAQYLARIPASGGAVEKLTDGRRVVMNPSPGPDGNFAALVTTATEMAEVHAVEAGKLRK